MDMEHSIREGDNSDDETAEEAELEMNQTNYNMFLTHLMLGDMKKGHEMFLRNILPARDNASQVEFLTEVCHMVFQSIKGSTSKQEAE